MSEEDFPTRFDNIRNCLLGDTDMNGRVQDALKELDTIEQLARRARSELGVPGDGYLAPVANAAEALQEMFE